jgi:hypothetical protein
MVQLSSCTSHFPMKLYDMLQEASKKDFEHIVSWLPCGNSFQIHDQEALIPILQVYFNQTKYKSFLRQLQNYGFLRVTKGQNRGTCKHRDFVRGSRPRAQKIRRVIRPLPKSPTSTKSPTSPKSVTSLPTQILSTSMKMLEKPEIVASFDISKTTPKIHFKLLNKFPLSTELLFPDIERSHLLCLPEMPRSEVGIFEGKSFYFIM